MEATARLSYLHISPRKVRLVAHVVKGMEVRRAELELSTLSKHASRPIEKLLKSAVQNAVHDLGQDASRLYIKHINVDAGPVLKRMMPRAFGRGAPIRKRMSHISLVLGVRGEDKADRRKVKKQTKPVARIADWQEIKDEMGEHRAANRDTEAISSPKKSGGFVKKIFTRKVI